MRLDDDIEFQEVDHLLAELDHPVPAVDPERLAAVARARGAARVARWPRWAAGMMLSVVLAGAAYAIPGSPLAGWVRRLVAGREAQAPIVAPAPARDAGGIALDPGPRFAVLFRNAPPAARVHVTLTDSTRLVVSSPGGGTRFTSEEGRLVIELEQDSMPVEISLPRSAPWVEIHSGAALLLTARLGKIASPAGALFDRSYLLPLTPSQTPR